MRFHGVLIQSSKSVAFLRPSQRRGDRGGRVLEAESWRAVGRIWRVGGPVLESAFKLLESSDRYVVIGLRP